ncbi:MAG: hypothetical protein QOF76_2989 [Solirubrobacteraceae bacterium]|nr:hypothetical protein [Solirubrobacteraceae bacterium]
MAVARLLMRHGFEVIYLGRFNTPEKFGRVAADEDAEVVGVSVHSWEFLGYADDLVAAAREAGAAVVVGGAVITEGDRAELTRKGVDAVFGSWAGEDQIVTTLDALVAEVRARRAAPA